MFSEPHKFLLTTHRCTLWEVKEIGLDKGIKKAFKNTMQALLAAVPLAHPDTQAILLQAVDASATQTGAFLQQWQQGARQPLAFFCQKFTKPQQNYSTFDR